MHWNETVIDDVRFRYQPAGQESGPVSHTPALEGEEITRRERKRRPLRAQSDFPLNLFGSGRRRNSGALFPLWSTSSYWNPVPRRDWHFSLYLNKQ